MLLNLVLAFIIVAQIVERFYFNKKQIVVSETEAEPNVDEKKKSKEIIEQFGI